METLVAVVVTVAVIGFIAYKVYESKNKDNSGAPDFKNDQHQGNQKEK